MRYVAKMLKWNKTVTQKDRGGRTPLHVAVSCSNLELISLLLEHDADVSSADTLLGLSSVQYATRMVDWEMLSLIMEKRREIRVQVLN
jgi:ankyrin repeat protein